MRRANNASVAASAPTSQALDVSAPAPPLLSLKEVCRTFGKDEATVNALTSVSLDIGAGESWVISGPSGSGKSTLLNILGLLDTGYEGELILNGHRLDKMSPRERDAWRARLIGFVFQDFQLVPYLDVTQNVEFGLTYDKIPATERHERVKSILDAVGLSHRAHASTTTLSGGDKQRLAIARTLVRRPALLLADEPTGNLDQKTSAHIMQLLTAMQSEYGYALVVVTHDPGIVGQFANRINVLDGVVTITTEDAA